MHRIPHHLAKVSDSPVKCPICQSRDGFIATAVYGTQFKKMCARCRKLIVFPLPHLEKKLIYLDQFVITFMMNELDPDREASRKKYQDGFYLNLFDRLNRLVKLQLIVCPQSPIHQKESMVDSRFQKMEAVYEKLSQGVRFRHPGQIIHSEILLSFRSWVGATMELEILSPTSAMDGEVHEWYERPNIRVEKKDTAFGCRDDLLRSASKLTARLKQVADNWKNVPDLDFEKVQREEALGIGQSILRQFDAYSHTFMKAQTLEDFDSSSLWAQPPEVSLITRMSEAATCANVDAHNVLEKIHEFFSSDTFLDIFAIKTTGLFWATTAKEMSNGGNRCPKSSFYNDLDAVAIYGPFCDAMFFENKVTSMSKQGKLRHTLKDRVRLFCPREKQDFIRFLEDIETAASSEHINKVKVVYGENLTDPEHEILVHR